MKKTLMILSLFAALSLIVSTAIAQQAGQAKGQKAKGPQAQVQLTAEQRTQLEAKLKELRAAQAKPEAINEAIRDLYKGWGLTPPQGRALIILQLTPEQRKQVREKMKELHAANAKPEEIRAALAEMLKGFGYELPQAAGEGKGKGKNVDERLTAEQRQQLQAKLKELKAANAKPEEIKAAIAELYKGWGLELPKRGEAGAKLTTEQRTELQAKLQELKAAGAKREEIKAAVAALYKQWGLQPPQKEGGHKKDDAAPGGLRRLMEGLTAEQRQQVLAKIDEMKQAGSTQEEIKAKIMEMIKGFGDKV